MSEVLTFLGIAVSLALGVWNLLQTRRTQFINTVTSERVKWIQELRKNISAFCGAVHTWTKTYQNAHQFSGRSKEEIELIENIDRLSYLIRLQLNPKEDLDNSIEKILKRIPILTGRDSVDELMEELNLLTKATQVLLKNEWEKVKKEASKGFFPECPDCILP